MNIDELKIEYRDFETHAEPLIRFLQKQFEALLHGANAVLAVPIQHRIKTFDSILEKSNRKGIDLEHIHIFNDLVGFRLIFLNQSSVQLAEEVLAENFDILDSQNKASELGPSQFGYQSVHYNIRIPVSWQDLPQFKNSPRISIEVQLRTLSQHVWAVLSHDMQYKNESSVPENVLRSVSRLSALLETVDLEINRIFKLRDDYRENMLSTESKLNVDSLEQLLDSIYPAQNKRHPEFYADLLGDMYAFNIQHVSGLKSILDSRIAETLDKENELAIVDDKPKYTHVGLASYALSRELGKKWVERRNKTIAKQFNDGKFDS